MTDYRIPPMEPLAPIVDQLRELATDHLPEPRTCRTRLWDDGTFDAVIYHGMADTERQLLRYERTTSEILWEHLRRAGWETQELSGGETVYKPSFDEVEVQVIETVDPPYR